MAFCNTCGAQLEEGAKFCTTCGATIAQEAPVAPAAPAAPAAPPAPAAPVAPPAAPQFNQVPPAQQQYQAPPPPPSAEAATNVFDPQDVADNKVMAILAYIIFLVPLIAAKESPFAKFHTNQGLALFLGWIICCVVNVIPILGTIVGLLGGLLVTVLSIIGIINAAKGEGKELPIVGKIKILK